MKIISEVSIENFEAWSGGRTTLDRIISEGKCNELESYLEELFPDGATDTEINDLLWFDSDSVYEYCGMRTESEIRNELEEAKEQLENIKQDYENDCNDMEDDFDSEEDFENAKYDLWHGVYEDEAKELEERIEELEEELENIW